MAWAWVWRSFFSPPHPLLLSSLRPARRHGSQLTNFLGSNKQIGSRGYAAKSNGDSHAKVKRHLYVVLDNYLDGYGVHKLDLSDDDDYPDGGVRPLQEPPFLRVPLTTLRERVQFAAVGSNIVGTGTTYISPSLYDCYVPGKIGGVLIYDINTAELTVTPHLPQGLLDGGYKAAMAIGDTLYMLGSETPWTSWNDDSEKCGGSLHCLAADLDEDDVEGDQFWGWELLSGTSPWYWSDFRTPPKLPFVADHITAHVAHLSPRRRPKILVSLRPTETSPLGATFAFSMWSGRWRRHGQWYMPVLGQVHYDGPLDAWVGLHAVTDGNIHGPLVTDGRLCVGNNTSPRSEWKVGKEKLFRLDEDGAAGWKHVDAKLVPIASTEGGSEYCLLERMRLEREEDEEEEEEEEAEETKLEEHDKTVNKNEYWDFYGGKGLLRLTFYRVVRGQDGEPMATACRPARSYEVSWHNRHFDAQAFWI